MMLSCIACGCTIFVIIFVSLCIFYSAVICKDDNNFKLKNYRIITESTTSGVLYIPQWSYYGKIWHNFTRYVCYIDDVGTERYSFDSKDACMSFLKKEYCKNRTVINNKKRIINFEVENKDTCNDNC